MAGWSTESVPVDRESDGTPAGLKQESGVHSPRLHFVSVVPRSLGYQGVFVPLKFPKFSL